MWLVDRILASEQGVLSEEYDMAYFPEDDLFASLRPRGLPIGNLTSQWWANCYLNPFDQFVKRELGCAAYIRYVDDFLLFGDSRSRLMNWREKIIERLERFRLKLHEESMYPRQAAEGIPFLGFVLFPDHRRLKARKGYAFRRKLISLSLYAPREKIKASVQGWIAHARCADTHGLIQSVLKDAKLLSMEY